MSDQPTSTGQNITVAPANTGGLERDLGRVEGKIDGMVTSIAGITSALILRDTANDVRFVDTNERISRLEKRQYWLTGAAAAFIFIASRVDITKLMAILTAASH